MAGPLVLAGPSRSLMVASSGGRSSYGVSALSGPSSMANTHQADGRCSRPRLGPTIYVSRSTWSRPSHLLSSQHRRPAAVMDPTGAQSRRPIGTGFFGAPFHHSFKALYNGGIYMIRKLIFSTVVGICMAAGLVLLAGCGGAGLLPRRVVLGSEPYAGPSGSTHASSNGREPSDVL